MEKLVLFSTSACHLCELAEAQLHSLIEQGYSLEVEKVDIVDSDALMDRYGVTIPVVRREQDGCEIAWPFTESDLAEWLR